MKKIYLNHKGFTLIEALVAMTIFAVIGVIAADLLARTFEGNNKAQIISKIKQNGQSALNTMDETIRGASSIECVGQLGGSSPNNAITVSKDGQKIRFKFNVETLTPSSNGTISMDVLDVNNQNFDPDQFCLADTSADFTKKSSVELTDINKVTGVSLKNGNFNLDKGTNPSEPLKALVTIAFNLGAGINAPANLGSQLAPVPFQTTITLR